MIKEFRLPTAASVVVALVVACGTVSQALAADEDAPAALTLEQQVENLRRQVASLNAVVQTNTSAIGELTTGLQQLTTQAEKNFAEIEALNQRIESLEADGEAFAEMAKDNQSILAKVTTRAQDGEPHLRLLAMNEDGRQELRKAIVEVAPTEGELLINNRMATDQYLMVNGQQRKVDANSSLRLSVPAGTVSTQLPGQELVNWTVGMPDYSQTVDIRPKDPQVTEVRRVVSEPASIAPTYVPSTYTPMTYYDVAPITYYDPWTGMSYFAY